MSDIPEPLTPAECDLQDFPFMPLDVARLRDSELASNETPDACWAAVLIWAASWHQVPAASIPDDDLWIAKVAGYQLRGKIDKAWGAVRPGALRGWVKCSDGRLYHPVVAEKARDAWQAKLEQRWRTECARIKKHNDRHEGANVPRPTFDEWLSAGCPHGQPLFVPRDTNNCPKGQAGNVPGETDSKRQGEGQGQGQGDSYSVPYGTGGEPPLPPLVKPAAPAAKSPSDLEKSRLWRLVKQAFVEQKTCPDTKAAGVLAGGIAAKYGNDVFLEAARAMERTCPVDAHTYLVGLCETAAGKRQPLNKQEAIEARNRNVAAEWAAQGEAHAAA